MRRNLPAPSLVEGQLCSSIDVRQNHELHRLWVDHYNATSGVVRVLGECELAWRAGRAKDQQPVPGTSCVPGTLATKVVPGTSRVN